MDPDGVETLRDVLVANETAAGAKGGSWFERQSIAVGSKVRYTTFDGILKGSYHHRPTDRLLDTIAAIGERHGVEDVRRRTWDAAHRPMPTGEFAASLPSDVDTLNPASREVVISVIRNMLELQRAADAHATVVPIGEAPSAKGQRRKAARKGTPGEGGASDDR